MNLPFIAKIMGSLSFNLSAVKKDNLEIVGLGFSSNVVPIKGTTYVAKIPVRGTEEDLDIERRVRDRLQNHPHYEKLLRNAGENRTTMLVVHRSSWVGNP